VVVTVINLAFSALEFGFKVNNTKIKSLVYKRKFVL